MTTYSHFFDHHVFQYIYYEMEEYYDEQRSLHN